MTTLSNEGRPHRLIVTGSTGALGRNFLEVVARWPKTEILALLRSTSSPKKQFERVRCQRVDFDCREELDRVTKEFQPTSIIHCAADGMSLPRPEWFNLIRFNVNDSLYLCESASHVPGCQIVFLGTGLSYRDQGRKLRETDPMDTEHRYGASKAASDILMRAAAAEFGVPMVVLRPFTFCGVGDYSTRLFPSLLRAATEKKPFDLSPGDQIRDHCAAGDIAQGIAQAVLLREELGPGNHVFNLGSGSTARLKEVVHDVIEQTGLDVQLNFGARPYARFEPMFMTGDISLAEKELHWQPRTNFAYAVWELARESFPNLPLKKPRISL